MTQSTLKQIKTSNPLAFLKAALYLTLAVHLCKEFFSASPLGCLGEVYNLIGAGQVDAAVLQQVACLVAGNLFSITLFALVIDFLGYRAQRHITMYLVELFSQEGRDELGKE